MEEEKKEKSLLSHYGDLYSEMWPEEEKNIRLILESLYKYQEPEIFEQFCEHIQGLIKDKNLAQLKLSANLARRMNFMISAEKPTSTRSSTNRYVFLVGGLLFLALVGYYIFFLKA